MIYFCADDYGISKECNTRIMECFEKGVLNKVSVLPNGELGSFKEDCLDNNLTVALHLNLVEGRPLSNSNDINLIVSKDGNFKYSFIGLLLNSFSFKRKEFEKQLYKEIKSQLNFWQERVGKDKPIFIDSHQHTHMIPLVFKTLLRVIKDEGINVDYLRIPAEPITPYLATPSLYKSYKIKGIIKHWLLIFLNLLNQRQLEKSKIRSGYFMGVMFSGSMEKEKIEKLLFKYEKLSQKHNKDIEIALHPGYAKDGEQLIKGCRTSFEKFYFSPWREKEYDALINLKQNY